MTQVLPPALDAADFDLWESEWCDNPYLPEANAETFSLQRWLAGFDPEWFKVPLLRRELTARDPLLFACVYFAHHLRSDATDGQVTLADAHLGWVRDARGWLEPVTAPMQWRKAYIAPRETGKSTWWFLILPMWAAAHGHIRFAAAFADSGTQAEIHLGTFRRELLRNQLLRADYPQLCSPARRQSGRTEADSQGMYYGKNGFVFAARGIDSSNLGMKVDEMRPELLLFDDIEPDESNYSQYQKNKRMTTVIDAIFPMNLRARVAIIGTVTMHGSIIHELVQKAAGDPDAPGWIEDEKITVRHDLPVILRDDGSERSIWPAKWPMAFLNTIRHTRSYAKNFKNDPMGVDGEYWTMDDFIHGQLDGVTFQILSIDPAVTTKNTSDWTGMAVIGYAPARRTQDRTGHRPGVIPARCVVEDEWLVRLVGKELRRKVVQILQMYPSVRAVLIEINQGGENWFDILHDLPVKIVTVNQTVKKELRAANTLNHYQRGRVLHARKLPKTEGQMCAFPRGPHDDLVDAVGSGVERLFAPKSKAGRAEVVRPR